MLDKFPMQQVLNEEGKVNQDAKIQEISIDKIKRFYYLMLRARLLDKKSVNLQRQGRIGTYVQYEGQEAAQVGSAIALEEGDWMFPTYRDHAATLTFGHSMRNLLLNWRGRLEGGIPPEGVKIFPPAIPIASQLPHATGAAWAEKKRGTDRVSLVYFGDGATSEGDFHEGLNFASLFHVPAVFFNQNNGFAISVPMNKQMKAKTIAQKGLGYDMECARVDGNDILAVYFAVQEAVERARKGEGPTLLEAVTWRYGAHTTADDPSKYRDQSESETRRQTTDPLLRLERYMRNEGEWDAAWVASLEEEINEEIEMALLEMENYPDADISQLFDHVYDVPTWPIQEQIDEHLAVKGRNA
ncbi:pyruvate dehydrogenase (acetyl-transferring) E1 component subunit alpha [Salibacterium salarium]|uniref:Pyruvate dehydrogenase E1 component subunit alpha n=1 Tax=Salibacterium salarium TaxID=284579 RepID=A0A428N407_9BACI|nr:pyruvate dehydrogenase (acetyl-transferring) E1 component subunit alpha [Salibacterium salarium]RSL33141.1 pyruvate dehydrogenase (acetyl-transferring) E1 component subunit alpha [Salibacterium salarium]